MGSNHARVLSRLVRESKLNVELAYIVDIDQSRAEYVSKTYGGKPVSSIDDISELDGAIVATPTSTHYEIVSKLVDKGVNYIFVEKPMTLTLTEAIDLVEKLRDSDIVLNVGYIERFNPAFIALLRGRMEGSINDVLTIVSRRIGPFAPRAGSVDVTLDLGSHEVDAHTLIMGRLPLSVKSFGLSNIVSNRLDHAWIIMNYGDTLSLIEVSRVSPVKLRVLYITSKSSLVFLNYIDQKLNFIKSTGEEFPNTRREEPLFLEDYLSIAYYQNYRSALVDAYQGLVVQYICEAIGESYRRRVEAPLGEDSVYSTYSDFFIKGLDGFRKFLFRLMDAYKLVSS
ncbi:MAG: Gfo/Idh/MocA family oxidoreductase [Desulfurococcaceae archaeon]